MLLSIFTYLNLLLLKYRMQILLHIFEEITNFKTFPLNTTVRPGMQYLSTVFHLLLPVRQPPASLLLLFQGFLGGRAQIFISDDLADLFASFWRGLVLLLSSLFSTALPGEKTL